MCYLLIFYDESHKLVATKIKTKEVFIVVFVYAWGLASSRPSLWTTPSCFQVPVNLLSDFNIVESSKDRYLKKGVVISGREKRDWNYYKDSHNPVDAYSTNEFMQGNSQKGIDHRETNIDRAYVSMGHLLSFDNSQAKVFKDLYLFYHKPIMLILTNSSDNIISGWFHVE